MNITGVLSDEHQNILKVIDSVLAECASIESGKAVDNEYFNNVVYFIRNYADAFHHAKEEDILFKELLNNLENMHCNPIPVMFYEHDEGRQYVSGMVVALKNNEKELLIENARGYCYLLENHIYKEDNILYPMAEEALNDDQKSEVEHAYRRVNISNYFSEGIEAFMEKIIRE